MISNSGGEKKDWLQRLMRGWLAPPPGQDWVLEAEWSRIMQTPVKARGLLYLVSLVLFLLVVWYLFVGCGIFVDDNSDFAVECWVLGCLIGMADTVFYWNL